MSKTATLPEGYSVHREEYEMPCEHVACDTLHQHLYNGDYEKPQLIDLYNMHGNLIGSRWETRFHVRTKVEWVILLNGKRVGDAHGTKREAVAEANKRPTI